MLKDDINADLKIAMLAHNKDEVEVLKGLKTAIQYVEVAAGSTGELNESQILDVLKKEQKKRLDAADLYKKANDTMRSEKELTESKIIEKYLPQMMSQEEVEELVNQAISEIGAADQKMMGQIIAKVKQASEGRADGATIASIVKGKIE